MQLHTSDELHEVLVAVSGIPLSLARPILVNRHLTAMGVPAFYRWLREKFGKCVEDCVEEEPMTVNGVEVPVNVRGPNPNGIEFDNLYLDMNGIIHPCVHPEDVPAPETEEEMFAAIWAYIDRLVAAVRPRRVLYMAIDGVAPRAKMNQQRARRFKAAQDMAEEEEVEAELRATLVAKGQRAPAKKRATFDHNVITPGTPFMDRLAASLRFYAALRVNTDPAWRDLLVILSDASVPGEGEHKIMEFVRQQRAAPGYNPNTRHVLHGLDADLIMLGLATHEVSFSVLREDVLGKPSSKCYVCGRDGHRADQCTGLPATRAERDAAAAGKSGIDGDSSVSQRAIIQRKPLQFLHLSTLREYLEMEFQSVATTVPWGWDRERAFDDFVFVSVRQHRREGSLWGSAFASCACATEVALNSRYTLPTKYDSQLCFFVGNDFLPHLPSLDIREGAIDLLLALYKQVRPRLQLQLARPPLLRCRSPRTHPHRAAACRSCRR